MQTPALSHGSTGTAKIPNTIVEGKASILLESGLRDFPVLKDLQVVPRLASNFLGFAQALPSIRSVLGASLWSV